MLIEISTRQILGVIHLAGATRISRYDMAVLVAEKTGLDKNLLRQSSINNMSWVAKRPRDSSLNVSKATQILKEKPMSVEQGLDSFMEDLAKR